MISDSEKGSPMFREEYKQRNNQYTADYPRYFKALTPQIDATELYICFGKTKPVFGLYGDGNYTGGSFSQVLADIKTDAVQEIDEDEFFRIVLRNRAEENGWEYDEEKGCTFIPYDPTKEDVETRSVTMKSDGTVEAGDLVYEKDMDTDITPVNEVDSDHWTDVQGNPAGGNTWSLGFEIYWQNGPLDRGENRKQPNGAFVEDVIYAAIDRLDYFQSSIFACEYNERALNHLIEAVKALKERTADREQRGVEGVHKE